MNTHKKKRKRIDYRKEPIKIKPITFQNHIIPPVTFLQEIIINHDYLNIIPNYYILNNFGEIKTINNEILEPKLINSGYYVYYLRTRMNDLKPFTIHRLVLMVFNPIPGMESLTVDHINRNKYDNRLSNLRWCTYSENYNYYTSNNKTNGVNNYRAIFNYKQLEIIVNEIDKGTDYATILNMIGMPVTKNNRDYISNIKRGITYKEEVKLIRENKVQRLSKA